MSAGRPAGRSDAGDDVATLHRLTRFRYEHTEMPVARRQTEIVADHHEVAVVAVVGRRLDDAVGGRVDRIALFGRDVDALVIRGLAREWIRASAKRASQPAMSGPDGRRRAGQRFALLDVTAHVAQPALETIEQVAQHAER